MLPIVNPKTKRELKKFRKIAKFAAKYGKLAINQETEIVRGFECCGIFWYVHEKEVESGDLTTLGHVTLESIHLLE